MSFLFSRSNSHSSPSDTNLSPYPPYTTHTLLTLLNSLPTDESGLFVGTVLPSQSFDSSSSHKATGNGYGYLSSYPTLVLGLADLHELVQLISEHLDVETPFVFSNGGSTVSQGGGGVPVAIDLDAGRVKRLIDKYVEYLTSKSGRNTNPGKSGGHIAGFDDEARFAGPHELGMLLRWGLARVLRIESSSPPQSTTTPQNSGTPHTRTLTRGLIPYLAYLNWAKQEHHLSYPLTHFSGLLDTRTRISVPVKVVDEFGAEETFWRDEYKEVIPTVLKETLITLFALLAKLVAHSAKSGATPPGLSPLFGPLLFGLGALPSDLISVSPSSISPSAVPPPSAIPSSSSTSTTPDPTSFESTYTSYLRSVHATEHCLLSFIRWQDTPTSLGGGGSGAGGIPGRLKEWIKDYPRTLSNHARVLAIADLLGSGGFRDREQHSLGPRKGSQTIRLLAVRRTVPVYDRDLVRSSARWGLPTYAAVGGGGLSSNSLPGNKEWGRVSPPVQVPQGNIISNGGGRDKGKGGKMPVRYSDNYRKKMNIPPGVEPGSSSYAPPLSSLSSSSSSYSSYSSYSYASTSSPLTRSTSSTSTYSFQGSSPPTSSSPTSPSTSHHSSQSSRFKTLSDAHWGQFESSGFLSPPSSSARGSRDIESALKFDLTESARKARTAKRGIRDSVDWGDFVNGGFDLSEQRRSGGVSPVALSSSTNSSHLNNNGYGYGAGDDPDKSYVGADGRLTDVGEFALDTGLDAALQFNLSEFGIIGSGKDRDKDGKEGKEVRGERERTITGVSLGKRLKKKEKPLPPFTYDSTPLLLPGSETLIEAAFVDVWTDLVSWGFAELGLGSISQQGLGLLGDLVTGLWNSSSMAHANPDSNTKATTTMSLSRSVSRDDEAKDGGDRADKAKWRNELFKECNWAMVEFKSLPSSHSHSSPSSNDKDPRTSTSLFLFEEYVPREYRAQLGHQLVGIHPSFILNPVYAYYPFNVLNLSSSTSLSTSSSLSPGPYSQSSIARTRLGSLFSPGASTSTLGLGLMSDSGRGKKEKKVKEAKTKKDKKDKKDKKVKVKTEKEKAGPVSFFSGSTRTLTSSTPTPQDSRNDSTPTPTPYLHSTSSSYPSRSGKQVQTPDGSPSTPTGPAIPRPPKDKFEEFDAMLADGNRGTKVITLNGALHTLSPEGGLGSEEGGEGYTDVEDLGDELRRHNTTTHEAGFSSATGSGHPLPPLPPPPLSQPLPQSLPSQLEPSMPTLSAPRPQNEEHSPITSTPIKNIFRLGPPSAALSPKPSSGTSKPALRPKGPKPKTSRRQSRQNLVPSEYHTVEFETRLTGLGSGGESDVDIDVDGDRFGEGGRRGGLDGELDGRGDTHGEGVVLELDGTRGDGFVEEAARRRRAARLAERDRLRSERRGKRFSLGLGGGPKGGDFDDDEAWVDIVVPGYGAHRVSVEASKRNGGPEEASQEVARVLSAVRDGQLYPGIDDDESIFEGVDNSATSAVKVNSDSDDVEVQMVPRFGKNKETGHANGLRIGHGHGGQGHHDDQSYTQSSKQSFTSGGDLDASYTSESYNFPDADAEEDPEFKPLTSSVPNRRLGYFDLHPERKRASQEMLRQITTDDDLLNVRQPEAMSSRDADMFASGSLNGHSDIDDDVDADDIEVVEVGEVDEDDEDDEDDPRARYAHGSDDEHDDAPRDLDKLYAAKTEKARPLPSLPPDQKSGSFSTSATFSSLPATSPPRSSSLPHSPAPSLASSNPSPVPVSNLSALTSIAPIVALSPTPPAKPSVLTSTFGSTSGTPGKTAALIEMYREKEKKSLITSSSLPALPSGAATTPSKIPVKAAAGLPTVHKSASLTMPSASFVPALTSSLPSLPTSPAAPVPAAKPLAKPSTSTSIVGINSQLHDKDDDSDDGDVNGMDELVPPSKVGLGIGDDAVDAGRASPGRYIHGAPLHNVLEEEEEEDEE